MGQIYGTNWGSPAADVSSTGRLLTSTQINGVRIRGSGVVTYDKEHDRLVEGRLFNCGSYFYGIPTDGSRSIFVSVGSVDTHLIFDSRVDGDSKLIFMENTQVTNSGAQKNIWNLHRCSTNTVNSKVWVNPTINAATGSGKIIYSALLIGGSGTGTKFASVDNSLGTANTDWLLCAGSCYWIKLDNFCGRSMIWDWNIKMHEHGE